MKYRKTSNSLVFSLVAIMMLTSWMSYDSQRNRISPKRSNWSATWICPRCSHENYSEINNCGVCGHEKPRKRR